MQAKDFCHWLAGYLEISEAATDGDLVHHTPVLVERQVQRISIKLRQVLDADRGIGNLAQQQYDKQTEWSRQQQLAALGQGLVGQPGVPYAVRNV